MQIEVSLEVYKALTERLSYDGQTYSDLIEELLAKEAVVEPDEPDIHGGALDHRTMLKQVDLGGFASRKLWLPHGTQLRARYRQKEYRARIENNVWLAENGQIYSSPSAAAAAITRTNVNGLRFWHALRPGDRWCRLDALVDE